MSGNGEKRYKESTGRKLNSKIKMTHERASWLGDNDKEIKVITVWEDEDGKHSSIVFANPQKETSAIRKEIIKELGEKSPNAISSATITMEFPRVRNKH